MLFRSVMLATLAGLWLVTQVAPVAAAFRFTPLPAAEWVFSASLGLAMLVLFQLVKRPLNTNNAR